MLPIEKIDNLYLDKKHHRAVNIMSEDDSVLCIDLSIEKDGEPYEFIRTIKLDIQTGRVVII